jgi:hypothetical protein
MQQFCTYGSVRGAVRESSPYRDKTLRSRPTMTLPLMTLTDNQQVTRLTVSFPRL